MAPDKRYALLSVSNKSGLAEFAKGLISLGYSLISTGGTAKIIREAGLQVDDVSDFTGFPEILDGRVKTLHPMIHGGILNIRNHAGHQAVVKEHKIKNIDIVAVNLYPFEETVLKKDASFEDIIENIDIGGPSMVRSAAKNHAFVTVVVDSADYPKIIAEIANNPKKETSLNTRRILAAKAFSHTALYDSVIAGYLNQMLNITFPSEYTIGGRLKQMMRYGENPHQHGAFYSTPLAKEAGAANAKQLHGKELSYNNVVDINSSLALSKEFTEPAAVIVKHNNPCGIAIAGNIYDAYEKALACDPLSAYGGIVALNRVVDKKLAGKLAEIFLEVIIAPAFSTEALELLQQKKNIRLMQLPDFSSEGNEAFVIKVAGGLLLQDADTLGSFKGGSFVIPTKRKPTDEEISSMDFAWIVAKHVKSNAIVYAKGTCTVGIGAGQMSRVDSSKIAAFKAQFPLKGTVMASDAFFPFRDSIDEAARHGVTAIVSPGGSVRDDEVIRAADEYNIAMIFTGVRHFRH